MKKEKVLSILVITLVVMNVIVISFLFLGRHHHPPGMPHGEPWGPPRPDKIIIETLHLNSAQQLKFDVLKHEHHEHIVQLDEEYEKTLISYLNLLEGPDGRADTKDSLEKQLGHIQTQKAAITFAHFKELQSICTPEQRKEFQKLIPILTRVIAPPGRP
jgi:protein CpxP